MSNKIENHLIIADGVDGAGKSQLSFHLIDKYRCNYIHHGVQPDIQQYHTDSLNIVRDHQMKYKSNWILDRLHVSEEVYGNIFRNGPQYDWVTLNENIIENLKEYGGKYTLIFCLPPKEKCLETHAKRLAAGNEMFDTIEAVYDAYEKIYEEYKDRFNIYKYDFTEDPNYEKLDAYLESL